MDVKYVKQVATPTNSRVIKHKIYRRVDGYITDEKGKPMYPSNNPDYWIKVSEYEYLNQVQSETYIFSHGGRNQGKSAQIQDLEINIKPAMKSMRAVADMIKLQCIPESSFFANAGLGRTSWEKSVWPERGLVNMEYSALEARMLNFSLKPEVTKMLKIEKVTVINGLNTDHLSEDDILNHIQNEEAKIATLEKLKTKSSAIDALKVKHTDNITLLVELLDSKAKK